MKGAALLLLAWASTARAQAPPDSAAYGQDFDALWTFVADDYAYPDLSPADWSAVRALYRPQATAAPTRGAFVGVLERALGELSNAHNHLSTNTDDSPRLVPTDADVWAEWQGGQAVVTSVRAGSQADSAGVRAGAIVQRVGGVPVREAVDARLPRTQRPGDARADGWALESVLAGTHRGPVVLDVVQDGIARTVTFTPGETPMPSGLLTAEVRPDGIGVVRLLNSLGEDGLVAAWDSALVAVRGTRGLILDLRDTPSGGNTTVARGIMGRLITAEAPYQRHERPSEERETGVRHRWLELASPRGPFTYAAPVVVLVGRWTGSMGEGLAIGLDGLGRARIVGTPMAGLLGAIDSRRLPNSGITVRISTERLAHVDGTPREAFVPEPVPADVDALAFALRLLETPR